MLSRQTLVRSVVAAAVVPGVASGAYLLALLVPPTWCVPCVALQAEDVERGAVLEAAIRGRLRRIEIKEGHVADLIACRTTLTRVTREFLLLNEQNELCAAEVRRSYPGRTDYERAAHNVLDYVGTRLASSPPEVRTRVSARLARELADLLDADGRPTDPTRLGFFEAVAAGSD